MRTFMSRSFAVLLTASALCSTSALAYAAPAVDAAGAKELKKVVDSTLEYYTSISKKEGHGIKIGGEVTVSPANQFYEIKIPNISVASSLNQLDLGTITINASPNDKGEYLTSMALPSTVLWKNNEGKPLMELKTGEQKFAGVFIPSLQTFSTINAEYKNMALTGKSEKDAPFTLKIGTLKNTLNLTENADKTWSGYNDATLTDIDLTAGGGQKRTVNAKIDTLSTKAFYDKMNLILAKESRDKVQTLYAGDKTPTDAELSKASQDLLKSTFNLLDSMNNKFEMTNFAFNTTPPPVAAGAEKPAGEVEKPISVNIAHASSSFDMRGILQDNGSLSLKTGISKIAMTNVGEDLKSIIPVDMNFELYFDNVPMKKVSEIFGDIFTTISDSALPDGGSKNPAEALAIKKRTENRIQDSLSALPGLLVKSGAVMSIRNTYINAPDVLSTLEGKVTAQETTGKTAQSIPATGTINLSIQGLDETVQNLQTKAPSAKNPAEVGTIVQGMTLLQMFGQPNKAPNGKSLRVYKLDMTADGKILLNGADLDAMSGVMGNMSTPAKQ